MFRMGDVIVIGCGFYTTKFDLMSGGRLNYLQLREFRKNLSKFVTFFEQNIITVNVLLIPPGGS